jgi:hypothetical protein
MWNTTMLNSTISQETMGKHFLSLVEVDSNDMPVLSEEEKKELLNILEQAEADGELKMSQFCIPMGT